MNLLTAQHLLPIQYRSDWERGHLTYMPARMYDRVIRSIRSLHRR